MRELPVDLFALFGRILWGYESGDGSIGASSLAGPDRFVAEVRRLRDDLLALLADRSEGYVVTAPDGADPVRPYFDLVWGDLLDGRREAAIDADRRQPDRLDEPRLPVGGLVVVLGAARSGTTWLHRMLSAHPAVAGTAIGETWLFPDVVPIWEGLAGAVQSDLLVRALRGFCDRLLAAMRDREKPGADHVSEKTPATAWRLPMMAELYPDAHYVHIVRDGRDAALSMARAEGGRDDLQSAAQAWVDAVTEIRSGSAPLPSFREVRYEDLLADHRRVVGELWGWLGLEVSDATLATADHRRLERVSPLPSVGAVGAGKWKALPQEDQVLLAEIEAQLLETLGYE